MYGNSSKAFIYSLNNDNGSGHVVYNPVKLQVRSYRHSYAVYLCASTGPIFGSHDIYISNYSASNQDSYTRCGRSYPFPLGDSLFFYYHYHYYYYYYRHRCTFYAGGFRFTPTNIEVFTKQPLKGLYDLTDFTSFSVVSFLCISLTS